jgi:hypothetical protein
MWCDKELEEKRKLRYYKDVINPNLEDQNYLSVFPSVKKKISIAKIRTNSLELHSETGVDTERGVNQYQVQFKTFFNLYLNHSIISNEQ